MTGEGRKIQGSKPERVCHRCRRARKYGDFTAESPYICRRCIGNGATAEQAKMLKHMDTVQGVVRSVQGMMDGEDPDGPQFTRAFIEAMGGVDAMARMAARDFQNCRGALNPDGSLMSEEDRLRVLGGRKGEHKTIRQWWETITKLQQFNDEYKRDTDWMNEVRLDELEGFVSELLTKNLTVGTVVDKLLADKEFRTELFRQIRSTPELDREMEGVIHVEAELVEGGGGDPPLPDWHPEFEGEVT
jgi:hypothetical protein